VLREALRKPEGKEHVYYVPIRSMIETPSYISFFTSGRNPERVCGLMIILFLKEQIAIMWTLWSTYSVRYI
jgi:hypothetical protein